MLAGMVGCLLCAGLAPAAEPSAVYRLTLTGLVERHDAVVTLYYRDGAFHQAYAELPSRDNLVHDVDPTPAQPIAFQYADGRPLEVPASLRDRYSYKRPDFPKYRDEYRAGTLNVIHPHPTAPLTLGEDGSLSGHFDILIYETDVPNTGGRQTDALVYRVAVAARVAADGAISGTATAWHYEEGDYDYGANEPRRELALAGRVETAPWRPDPGDAFAPGKDWPQVYGPFGTGRAHDCARELISDLRDARLVWVSEERIGGGRGSGSRRADFAMYPQPWTGLGYGGYATPAVSDGKVYLHHMWADRSVLEKVEGIERDIFLRLGNPIESLANDYNAYRDAVLCLDARTGQTLWHWKGDQTFGDIPQSKGGRGTTVAVANGKIYAVGHGGLYCLDAASGALVWHARGATLPGDPVILPGKKKPEVPWVSFGSGGDLWSKEMSPVIIGGAIVLIRDGHAVGINPADGGLRWAVRHATGTGAVGQRIVLDGRELLVCLGEVNRISKDELKADPNRKPTTEDLLLIDPGTGAVLVRSQALGASNLQPLVWDDVVLANGVRNLVDPFAKKDKQAPTERERAAAARIGTTGAERLWQQDAVHWPPFRATPVAHRGVAYIDSRETGFSAVDIPTGKVLGRHPSLYNLAGGDHNWTWHVAGNNRIITSGLLMFSTADEGFKQLPGRLSLPVAQGYMCPVKPALADGRLILRTENSILCYDLRARPETKQTRILRLSAVGAVPGLGPSRDGTVDIQIRERAGRLLTIGADNVPVLSADRLGVADWQGERLHSPYRSSRADALTLDAAGLRGDVVLRLGYNHESWSFDLKSEGDGFTGTYTRRATPLKTPLAVSAGVGGQHLPRPDGSGAVWALYLGNCIAGPDALAQGQANQALSIVVRVDAGGKVLGGMAASGRCNIMPWELDPGDLSVVNGRLRGHCTVLVRDDEFQDMHYERAREQRRPSADGGTLAIALTLDTGTANGQLNGQASGTIGAPWERHGRVDGDWMNP